MYSKKKKTGQSLVWQKAYYDRQIHGEKFNTGDHIPKGFGSREDHSLFRNTVPQTKHWPGP